MDLPRVITLKQKWLTFIIMEKNEEEVVIEEESNKKEDTEDTTDWKAKHDELAGRLKRAETKLEKSKIQSKVEEKVEKTLESKGLDRLDKILLRQEGIRNEKEVELVEQWREDTGKDIEKILENKHFLAELKDLREDQSTKDATPSGSKRSGQSPRDDVDYWIAKGELPKDNPELARKVVNAKMAKAKNSNSFSDTPVIS